MFIVNHLLLYVLMKFWCKLPEDGDKAETCRSQVIERIYRFSRRMRWAGYLARMGEMRGVYRVLMGKPEGKIPLGRPRLRWEDNIKMDFQEVVCGGMD